MNKKELVSAISIEFGMSKDLSERVIDNLFGVIAQSLKKNKLLKIQKFGKFKLMTEKDDSGKNITVKYYPSKKIAVKVNGNFDDLKKVKLKPDHAEKKLKSAEKKKVKEKKSSEINLKENKNTDPEVMEAETKRKLISDDLLKLHEEITKKGKDEYDRNI